MHHAIYKDYLYDKYLKAGYKLIVSVREPVAWFKSAVKFYHKEVKDKVNHNTSHHYTMHTVMYVLLRVKK